MGHDVDDVVTTEVERVAVDAGRGVDELTGLRGTLQEQSLAVVVELVGVHLAAAAELVDEPLGRAGAPVVAVELPRVELVAAQVDLERPAEEVVVAQVAAREAGVGTATVVYDLLGVLDRHDRRTELCLQEAHTTRRRSVEEYREYRRLVETADVDHLTFGHEIAFSSIFGGNASRKASVCFLIHTR